MASPAPRTPTLQATTRTLFFFPPLPPRLWAPLPTFDVVSGRNAAPSELREFVAEPFYPPLGTRLAQDSLNAAQRARLEAYHAARLALLAELRAVVDSTSDLDAVARAREFSALALAQAPRLTQLEAEAEAIRNDLIRSRDDWGALREWRLGSTPFGTAAQAVAAQYQVLRAAAYYQRGLSPAQRRLLREVVLDMENMVEMPLLGNELPADSNPLLPFSPETARIRLPSPMTAEVAELVSAYEREKSILKQELTDLLFEADDAFFDLLRSSKLEQLARSQASRFAQIEILAEKIRQALAASNFQPTPPKLPGIPPEIATRLEAYSAQQESVSRNVMRTVAHFQDIADIDQVAVRPTDNGRFEVNISVRRGADQQAQMELIKGKLQEFNAAHARRMKELEQERVALVNAVKWLVTKGEGPEADREAERVIATYMQAKEQRERFGRYRDYQIAVLEPGLSPEQRRLLFSAGLVALDLPLPSATFSPTTAFNARAREPRRERGDALMGSSQSSRDPLATPGRND